MDSVDPSNKRFDVGRMISRDELEEAAKVGGGDTSDAVAGAGQKNLAEKQHRSKVAALTKQIDHQHEVLEKVKGEHDEQNKKAEDLQEVVSSRAKFNERIVSETAKLDALETEENTKQWLC